MAKTPPQQTPADGSDRPEWQVCAHPVAHANRGRQMQAGIQQQSSSAHTLNLDPRGTCHGLHRPFPDANHAPFMFAQRQAEIMINQIGEGITSFEVQQRADAASFSTPVASRSSSSNTNTNTSTSQASSIPVSAGIETVAARYHHHPTPGGDMAHEQASRQAWGPPIHSSPGTGWMDSAGAFSSSNRASHDELSWAQSMIKGEIHAETSGVLLVTDVTHERLKELLATEKAAQHLGWENSLLRRALESASQSLAEKDGDMLAVMTEWRLKV